MGASSLDGYYKTKKGREPIVNPTHGQTLWKMEGLQWQEMFYFNLDGSGKILSLIDFQKAVKEFREGRDKYYRDHSEELRLKIGPRGSRGYRLLRSIGGGGWRWEE